MNGRGSVLNVFGFELEVSSARLAELLAMDAREALTTDVRGLVSAEKAREARETLRQAAPDVLIGPVRASDDDRAMREREARASVRETGRSLGFEPRPDGVWFSPSGAVVVTRIVTRTVTPAAGAHFVDEFARHRERVCGPDGSALFVVENGRSAEAFAVGIRLRGAVGWARTCTLGDLRSLRALCDDGRLAHGDVLALLAPCAGVELGCLLRPVCAERGTRSDAASAAGLRPA